MAHGPRPSPIPVASPNQRAMSRVTYAEFRAEVFIADPLIP